MEKITEQNVPPQQTGAESNTEARTSFPDDAAARQFYRTVKERLLHVNNWHALAGKGTAEFQLIDENGRETDRAAKEGDHFRIDIPGPGTITGEGYDWVRIESVNENAGDAEECLAIRVRPCSNPNNDRSDVAHFFSEDATSSFVVKREGAEVVAAVYGRNEKPNTDTEKLVDKARHTAVATGAVSGFSKLQWKSLVNGLISKENQ